ncbi:MAG: carbohydrate ABC transporter permease [Bacillota bacterium]
MSTITPKTTRVQPRRLSAFAQEWRRNGLAYKMVAPAVLFMILVHLVPMLQGIAMSFFKLNQYTLRQFLRAPFIGLDNYYRVLFDPDNPVRAGLALAARNTAIYAVVVTTLVLVAGMGVAILMNRQFKGRTWARTMMLLPWVVPSYVVGILWGFMWQQDAGIINRVLVDWLHILPTKPFWLIGPNTIWAIIIPTVWRSWPYVFIVFLAALQTIPDDLYEAAAIDGATAVQKFRHITLPMMMPVIAIQVLFQIIANVYSYNIVIMMFGNGAGFPGAWGDLLMTAIQRQSFNSWLFGYGAAASVLLMVAMMFVVWLWYRIFRRELVIQ